MFRQRGSHVADVVDEHRLRDLPVCPVVQPLYAGAITAQEADERVFVAARPQSPRCTHRAFVRAERLGRRQLIETAIAREKLERGAQQRRGVLSRDQVAIAVGRAARTNEGHVGLDDPVALEQFAQNESEAVGYRVDGQGLALEIGKPVSYTHLTLPTNREV